MNKLYKYVALLSVSLVGLAGCLQEEVSTDQFSDENVTFAGMAPNPVARGGALRIQGSNLDRIVEVRIPGVEPITDIFYVDTLKGRISEIRVMLPVDGPEVGKVTLVDGDGNEYASLTDLTYTEPIIFKGFSPETAMPGDVVTLKGDYLNNILTVQIGESVVIREFLEQSRYEMTFAVPSEAVTGNVILSDVDEKNNPDGLLPNLFYSDAELVIGDPTVDKKERGVLRAGETIVVTGEYLNMIKSAAFKHAAPGSSAYAYESVNLKVAEDAKSAAAVLSSKVADGELILTSYAGKEFSAGSYETLVPSELAYAAADGYKAGNEMVITGKNLDLVTSVTMGGASAQFIYADGKITATIPKSAKDGKITVKLANGKKVDAEGEVTFVKPTITALSKTSLVAGDTFVIEGTDLDLVTAVLMKDKSCKFEYDKTTQTITVTTTASCATAKVTIKTGNGTSVDSEAEIVVEYDSLISVTSLPSSASVGDAVTMSGSNFNMIEAIYFGEVKVTDYTSRSDEEVVFVIPETVESGSYQLRFVLTSGEEEICQASIQIKGAVSDQVLWEGYVNLAWNGDENKIFIQWSEFEGVVAGAKLELTYFIEKGVWGQAQLFPGDWSSKIVFGEYGNDDNGKQRDVFAPTDFIGEDDANDRTAASELTLTQEILDFMQLHQSDTGLGLAIQGANLAMLKIRIL